MSIAIATATESYRCDIGAGAGFCPDRQTARPHDYRIRFRWAFERPILVAADLAMDVVVDGVVVALIALAADADGRVAVVAGFVAGTFGG